MPGGDDVYDPHLRFPHNGDRCALVRAKKIEVFFNAQETTPQSRAVSVDWGLAESPVSLVPNRNIIPAGAESPYSWESNWGDDNDIDIPILRHVVNTEYRPCIETLPPPYPGTPSPPPKILPPDDPLERIQHPPQAVVIQEGPPLPDADHREITLNLSDVPRGTPIEIIMPGGKYTLAFDKV